MVVTTATAAFVERALVVVNPVGAAMFVLSLEVRITLVPNTSDEEHLRSSTNGMPDIWVCVTTRCPSIWAIMSFSQGTGAF